MRAFYVERKKCAGGYFLIEHRPHFLNCLFGKFGSVAEDLSRIFGLRKIFDCLLKGVYELAALRVIVVFVLETLLRFQGLGNCALQFCSRISQVMQLGHSFLDPWGNNQYGGSCFAVRFIAIFSPRDVTSATKNSEQFLRLRKNEKGKASSSQLVLLGLCFLSTTMKMQGHPYCNAKSKNTPEGLYPSSLRLWLESTPANPFAIHVYFPVQSIAMISRKRCEVQA